MGNITTRIAKNEDELNAIYKLRYKIYIEELGRTQKYANHEQKTIIEPFDSYAENIGAYNENNELVGAVRLHFCNKGDNSYYPEVYKMNLFGKYFPDKISYVTKLIVVPEHRRNSASMKLATACYEVGKNTDFNFIDCYEPVIPFFLRLGYRFYSENTFHPEFGEVIPMVALPHDLKYFEKIKSPFATAIPNGVQQNNDTANYFNNNFKDIHNKLLEKYKQINFQL